MAVAVTFFYKEHKLAYLSKVFSRFKHMPFPVAAYIITNVSDRLLISSIRNAVQDAEVKVVICTPKLLGHPMLLPWSHFPVFQTLLATDGAVKYFMYLEDDIWLTEENIAYWLEGRERLRPLNLIPSFLRYEKREEHGEPYCTDILKPVDFDSVAKVQTADDYWYINMPWPYQGMYFLDRELMREFFASPAYDPNFGSWGFLEKATQGVTFVRVPQGFVSRNLVGFDLKTLTVDPRCLIHHLLNNYTTNPESVCGKILCRNVIVRHGG